MKTKIIIYFLFLSLMPSCNKISKNKIDGSKENKFINHADTINKSGNINDSFTLIKEDKFCSIVNKKNEDDDLFLSEFIFYFKKVNINQNELNNEKNYQIILQKSNVSELPEYYFKKEYHTFSLINKEIKDYGKCYIAEYYFNDALGYMQSKFYVIVNVDKSEISIWNFDNLKVAKKGLECDFNVRGKHTIYNFVYSKECEKFILL
ncbi:hypothetical protein ACFSX9_00355 [Flavobacterium ardleyense]|uniref:Lipoprotein n=1 Tax=Flavobacterium ardleyense TaxID=2038737 RepID=A0ABW5Z2V1_9FLAO